MDRHRLDQAARAIYETLAAAGHGPRPWAAHSPNAQPWEDLPPRWRDEYTRAAAAALSGEHGGQQLMAVGDL